MVHIDNIINELIANFDFAYMIIVNIFTYLLIKIIDYFNNEKKVSIFVKRICLVIAIVIIAYVYVCLGYKDYIVIVNSAILAPVFWSWVLRPICVKLNINYKNIDIYGQ